MISFNYTREFQAIGGLNFRMIQLMYGPLWEEISLSLELNMFRPTQQYMPIMNSPEHSYNGVWAGTYDYKSTLTN